MSEYILFSPVGTTDPIRDGFEGGLLHIIRHYNPGIIYIYLTLDMDKRDQLDNRFERAIKEQARLLNRNPAQLIIHKIQAGISDPSDFDAFSHSYQDHFSQMISRYPDAEILINLSSGTPQMIATACLMIASRFVTNKCCGVQVVHPLRSSGEKSPYTNDYNDEMIGQLYDFLEEAENRCLEPNITFYHDSMIRQRFVELIQSYDYHSAHKLMNQNAGLFSQKTHRWVKHVHNRENCSSQEAMSSLTSEDMLEFDPYPVKNSGVKNLYEFYFTIMIRNLRADWSAYLMKLSPMLTQLIRYYIEEACQYLLTPLTIETKKGRKFSREKIAHQDNPLLVKLDQMYYTSFKDEYPMLSNLIHILDYIIEDKGIDSEKQKVYKQFCELREIEYELRNDVAHKMFEVSDEWSKRQVGLNFKQINTKMSALVGQVLGNYCEPGWRELPERMNQHILKQLEV